MQPLINFLYKEKTMTTKHEDLIEMTTLKKYTVTSQNCVKQLSDLDHGTMFIFPNKPEQLCMITNTMDGTYYFVELTTGNMHRTSPRDFEDVNPVSNFSAQITLA
jgi:hypothetical protein